MDNAGDYALGIDEAGRGAVMGPLVVAGVFLKTDVLSSLESLGVADSKCFGSSPSAQKKRKEIAASITQIGLAIVVKVSSCAVDQWTRRQGLNLLEIKCAQYILESGPCVKWAVADGEKIFAPLARKYPFLSARNRADENEPLVSAASIVAKHERDLSMNAILDSYKNICADPAGGGYVNKKTEVLLRAYYSVHKNLPSEVRRSWKWRILDELSGKKKEGQIDLF